MTEALSLPAILAALELEGVEREEWPEIAARLMVLHREVLKRRPKDKPQQQMVKTHGGTTRTRLPRH